MEKIIALLFTVLLASQVFAGVSLKRPIDVALKPHFSFFHDKAGKLSVKEIRTQSFSSKPLGGFLTGHIWAKTSICSNQNQEVHFIYKDPLEVIKVYQGQGSRPLIYSFLEQKGLAGHFWAKIDMSLPRGCSDLLVMFKSGDVMNFSARLMDSKTLAQAEMKYAVFYSVYYAFLILIFTISLFFLFKTRSKLYFYFCSLIVFQDILGVSLLNGFLFKFVLSPEYFVKYDIGNIFAPLMNASLVAFALALVKEKFKLNTLLSRLFIASQLLVVTPILLNLFIPVHTQNPVISQFVNQSILLSCLWVIYLAFCDIKSRMSQLFLLVSGFKVFAQFAKTLLLQGDISEQFQLFSVDLSFVLFNIIAIASFIEAVSITVILVTTYFNELKNKNQKIAEMSDKIKSAEIDSAVAKISHQVFHDIKSPLSSLKVAINEGPFAEKDRNLLRTSTRRIEDIVNELNRKSEIINGKLNSGSQKVLLISLIESILSEKRVQHSRLSNIEISHQITSESFGLFIDVSPMEFKRVLSNLIDNSVEAISDFGCVAITVVPQGSKCVLSIIDDGRGMDEEALKKLGEKGFSLGKEALKDSGSGLGFHYAKTTVESWGGKVKIESEKDQGTKIDLILPLTTKPSWFISGIELQSDRDIYVVDDDISIHEIIKNKFLKQDNRPQAKYFRSINAFEIALKHSGTLDDIYLIDYEFSGEDISGLDIIEKYELGPKAVLITSHYEDEEIVQRVLETGCKLLPKDVLVCVDFSQKKRNNFKALQEGF